MDLKSLFVNLLCLLFIYYLRQFLFVIPITGLIMIWSQFSKEIELL